MGHSADPARTALGAARALLVALILVAACGPAPSTLPGGPETVLLVAVTGLRADDPVLDELPSSIARSTDTVASGTGATAILELLDGRTALQQLREPEDPLDWAHGLGWSCRIDVMDPSLRSEPEWVHSFADWGFSDTLPEPADVDLHVVVARRDQFDDRALLDLLTTRGDSPVVVAGIPDRPASRDDAEQVLARFRVPVLTAGGGSTNTNPRTLADVLAPLRGEVRRAAERAAHWWDEQGGGVVVERAGGWVVGGSGRAPVAVGSAGDVDPSLVIDTALVPGSLLILVRGSEAADLTSLELLTSIEAEWSPWGLEPIDTVLHASPRYLRMDLAAEPEGDGILVADAHRQKIDVRLLGALEDAPLIGTPIRDAASGRWLGLDAIRISPWSRNYWRLTRRAAFDTAKWWPNTAAGIDLLWVREGTGPPAPVLFED